MAISRSLGQLTIDLIAKVGGWTGGLDKAERELKSRTARMDRNVQAFRSGVTKAFAAIGVGLSFREIIEATKEAERSLALLDNAVRATGGAAGFSTQQLSDMAADIQRVTTFSDDAVMGMQQLLLRFQSIRGVRFERAQQAILDLATVLGTDLTGAARLVGRALEDPERGLTALARSGVTFTDAQRELVKKLVETGEKAQAQDVILSSLEGRFRGAARASRDIFGGALDGLKNSLGDLLEGSGGSVSSATEAINHLTDALSDPRVRSGASAIVGSMFGILTMATNAALAVGKLIEQLGKLPYAAEQFREVGRLTGIVSEGFARMAGSWSQMDELRKQLADVDAAINNSFLGRPAKYWGKSEAELRAIREGIVKEMEAIKQASGGAAIAAVLPPEDEEGTDPKAKKSGIPEIEPVLSYARTYKSAMDELYEHLDQLTQTRSERELAQLNELEGALEHLYETGRITADQYNERWREAWDDIVSEVEVSSKKVGDTVKKQVKETNEFLLEAARNTQDILADGIYDAMNGRFGDILGDFKKMLDQMVANALAAKLAEKLFGNISSGSSGGGGWLSQLGTWAQGIFGGGREHGGPVSAGRIYPVLEGGPELLSVGANDYLMMGKQSGKVTPMASGGRGNFSPTINVNVRDPVTRRTGSQVAVQVGIAQRIAAARFG